MGLRTPRWAHRCSSDRSGWRRVTRQGALPGSVVLGRRAISTWWRRTGVSGGAAEGGSAREPGCLRGGHGQHLGYVVVKMGFGWSSGLMDGRRGRRLLGRRRLQVGWRLCGVLYRRVRSREHQPLMPVGVAHEVWRRPVLSPNLDDLRRLVGRTDHPAVHVDPVTYYCAHPNSSQGVFPAACTFCPVSGRGTSSPRPGRRP